jgi:hypothetical protein
MSEPYAEFIDEMDNLGGSGGGRTFGGRSNGDYLKNVPNGLKKPTVVSILPDTILTNSVMNSLNLEGRVKKSRNLALAVSNPVAFLTERANKESDILKSLEKLATIKIGHYKGQGLSQNEVMSNVAKHVALERDIMYESLDMNYPLDFVNVGKGMANSSHFAGEPVKPVSIGGSRGKQSRKKPKK